MDSWKRVFEYRFYYKLRSLPFVRAIYLFGSRAKGVAQERSDIDLALMCAQGTTDEQWMKVCAVLAEADTLLPIDCVRLDTLQDERLREEIERTKQVLFERKEGVTYSWYERFLDLGEALDKFDGVLQQDDTGYPYTREAAIQIFEYTLELFWKVLKKVCLEEGVSADSPRAALTNAYTLKLIDSEQVWLKMLDDRNRTSHTYQQPIAVEIYQHLKEYVVAMKESYRNLKLRYGL